MKRKKQGFTLVEMAVMIIIIGMFIAMAMAGMGGATSSARYYSTKNKIVEIKKALYKFYQANGRLPCPASRTALITDTTNYGLEIAAGAGDCATNATLNGTLRITVGSDKVRIGVLPVRTLNLREDMMYDSYDDRFTYLVTESFTAGTVNSPVTTDGVITVNDGSIPTVITSTAVFAVISHGSDKEGGYKKDGTVNVTCGSIAGRDDENCNNSDAILSDAQFNDLNKTSGAWFDDIIVWANSNEIQHWFDQ